MRAPTTRIAANLRRLLVPAALLTIVLVAATAPVPPAAAQESSETNRAGSSSTARTPGEVSNVVDEISQEMYSPYCKMKSLSMCPSGGAAEVRREIQERARQGMSKKEIKKWVRRKYRDQYLDTYGENFRWREPPAQDNYPLMALIVAGLIVCIVAVWLFARARGDEGPDQDGPEDEDWSDEDEIYLDEIRSQYQD